MQVRLSYPRTCQLKVEEIASHWLVQQTAIGDLFESSMVSDFPKAVALPDLTNLAVAGVLTARG